jgi:hypothetical protein
MGTRRIAVVSVFLVLTVAALAHEAQTSPQWAMNASIIEACSCPMFCQCYFNNHPAATGGHNHGGNGSGHFCKFNNVIKVNKGNYGATRLDGAKFWIAGDLGDEDFSNKTFEWAVLTFDPSVTPKQREGITAILGHVYPVKWKSFQVANDLPIDWRATDERAAATLDSGKAGEVVLTRAKASATGAGPVVIKNLRYWGVPRNDGFVLMPNEVEAYRVGDKAYEYKGTNGFMITFDINSTDVQ